MAAAEQQPERQLEQQERSGSSTCAVLPPHPAPTGDGTHLLAQCVVLLLQPFAGLLALPQQALRSEGGQDGPTVCPRDPIMLCRGDDSMLRCGNHTMLPTRPALGAAACAHLELLHVLRALLHRHLLVADVLLPRF